MFRFRFPRALALLACLAILAAATLAAQPPARSDTNPQLKSYSLAPDKHERAVAYSHWQYALHFLGVLWTAGTLAAILTYRLAPRLRDRGESASVRRFLQACLFVPGLLLTLDVRRLPLDLAGHWVSRHYDQSVQGFGSSLWDWTKGELLEFVI